MSDDAELLDVVFAWAETPKRQVCGGFADGTCPTTDGAYCLDCHGTAWSALVEVRQRILNGLLYLAAQRLRVTAWYDDECGDQRVRVA